MASLQGQICKACWSQKEEEAIPAPSQILESLGEGLQAGSGAMHNPIQRRQCRRQVPTLSWEKMRACWSASLVSGNGSPTDPVALSSERQSGAAGLGLPEAERAPPVAPFARVRSATCGSERGVQRPAGSSSRRLTWAKGGWGLL